MFEILERLKSEGCTYFELQRQFGVPGFEGSEIIELTKEFVCAKAYMSGSSFYIKISEIACIVVRK